MEEFGILLPIESATERDAIQAFQALVQEHRNSALVRVFCGNRYRYYICDPVCLEALKKSANIIYSKVYTKKS